MKRSPPAPPKVRVHVFQGTGKSDGHPLKPQEMCQCGSPRNHRSHDLPETPADARELEARRVGEKSE